VKDCGYTSGRSVTGVASASACLSCLAAETLPPADRYRLAVPTSVSSNTTLDDLKFQVEAASASGGGWVIYTMHDIGVNGSLWNIDPTLYSQFLDWLASRSDVQVRTVGDLMGQTWPTPTNTNTEPQAPPVLTPMALPNAGLEASTNGRTDCWLRGSSGTNTAIWSRSCNNLRQFNSQPYSGVDSEVEDGFRNLLVSDLIAPNAVPIIEAIKLPNHRCKRSAHLVTVNQSPTRPFGVCVSCDSCISLSSPVARNVGQLVSTFVGNHLLKRWIEVSHFYPC
jgi:hypothetical protein